MTEPDKRPPNDPVEEIRQYLLDSFERARAGVREELTVASNDLRDTLKAGEKMAGDAYQYVETTVGKDRVIGAVLGAKAGGTVGLVGGVHGMIFAGAVGAAAGFLGGRRFMNWYRADEGNDNDPSAGLPPP